ncbi:MAG: hypothetical protein Q8Q18_02190 [bacterium]|nr:hypothetical protein [bacterium]
MANDKPQKNKKSRISLVTGVYMMAVAIIIDLSQLGLLAVIAATLGLGVAVAATINIIVFICAICLFVIWFWLKGIPPSELLFSTKRLVTAGISAIIEIFPILSAIPTITLNVGAIIFLTYLKDTDSKLFGTIKDVLKVAGKDAKPENRRKPTKNPRPVPPEGEEDGSQEDENEDGARENEDEKSNRGVIGGIDTNTNRPPQAPVRQIGNEIA